MSRFPIFIPNIGLSVISICALLALSGVVDRANGAEGWQFVAGDSRVVIDAQGTGQIVSWVYQGITLVEAGKDIVPPLAIRMSDGSEVVFVAESHQEESDDAGRGLIVRGHLRGETMNLPAEMRYDVSADGREIRVRTGASQPTNPDAMIDLYRWSLPLSLNPRKRVYFKGEHGLEWETRYFYQYLANFSGLLPEPDRNEWRWFSLDQIGPEAFRLWKAESDTTAPLIMQEGKAIPPYMQIFDERGGVTVLYPGLAAGAPQSVKVDASGSARVKVEFWPSFAGPVKAEAAARVFESQHEIVLIAASGEVGLMKERAALNERYPSSTGPNPEDALREPRWVRETPMDATLPQYVTGGYPFPSGAVRDPSLVEVKVAGASVPVQARTLGFWPDGSAKWVLLTFPIDPGQAVDECASPRVSLRNGKFIPVQIQIGSVAAPVVTGLTVQTLPDENKRIVDGDLSIQFCKGTQWLSVRKGEKDLIPKVEERHLAYADYLLDPTRVFPFEAVPSGGKLNPGALSVDKVTVEESGPLRVVVRLEGLTNNEEPTRIIIRAEIEAGRPMIRLTHTAEFLFKDPRRTFLRGMGLELPVPGFDLADASFGWKTAEVPASGRGLLQASRFSRELIKDEARTRRQPLSGESGWVTANGEGVRFFGAIRRFAFSAPKAITVDPKKGNVRFEIWPNSVQPMDVRRYSNYPHLGQGEGVLPQHDWVEKEYYPNDPFVGISRTHEVLIGFLPGDNKVSAETLAADFESPPLLYAGWERYADTGVILPSSNREDWPLAWEAWTSFASFWLHHRDLYNWYGFWDFGDFRHHFQSGAGWILPPSFAEEALTGKKSSAEVMKALVFDAAPTTDWAYDNGRWGWGNTEGLPNLFLQNEYLRNGNRAVYFASEAMARFARDVVVRHDGKWLGMGTRHGVQHWSDGNHEERQTTSTEYRLNYFLSGDGRTRDVVDKLYEKYYSKTLVEYEAGHSGRWGGLFFHWEMTGSPQEEAVLRKYAEAFLEPDGLYLRPTVRFPRALREPRPKTPEGPMFFQYYGALHYLLEYQMITGDKAVKDALLAEAALSLKTPGLREKYAKHILADDLHINLLAFAAQHAEDPEPYREALRTALQDSGWEMLYQTVSSNPKHWSGDSAFLRGYIPGCIFWANWAPYLTKSLGTDSVATPEILSKIKGYDLGGMGHQCLRTSWQSEFDPLPGVSKVLDPQKPWMKGGEQK